jgi:hypothetical protein
MARALSDRIAERHVVPWSKGVLIELEVLKT